MISRNRKRVGRERSSPPAGLSGRRRKIDGLAKRPRSILSLPPAFPRVCRGGRLGERLHCLHRAGNDIRLWRMRRRRVGEAGELAGQSSSPAEQAGRGRRYVDWRRAEQIQNARSRTRTTRTMLTMKRRFAARLIDAPATKRHHTGILHRCLEAVPHHCSMPPGPKSCIIMHNNASLGCGSRSLRGKGENPASLASGSRCLRRMPCILAGRIRRARRKCCDDNDLRRMLICRNNNGV